jgi:hypothetical protein
MYLFVYSCALSLSRARALSALSPYQLKHTHTHSDTLTQTHTPEMARQYPICSRLIRVKCVEEALRCISSS